jgi:hypothetical protein
LGRREGKKVGNLELLTKERGRISDTEREIANGKERVRNAELSQNLAVNPNMKKERKKERKKKETKKEKRKKERKKEENKSKPKRKYGREVEFV